MDHPDERAAGTPRETGPAHPDRADQPDLIETHEIGNRTYVVAQVDPLDVDGTRTIAVGTGLWLVAFLLMLPFHDRLASDGRLWWMWTCLAGFVLGLIGWEYCRRRRNRRRAGTLRIHD